MLWWPAAHKTYPPNITTSWHRPHKTWSPCAEALFFSGPGKDLEFTIVRPGGLNLEPPNGIVNVIDGEAGSISRADVAGFLYDALTDVEFPYIGKVGQGL